MKKYNTLFSTLITLAIVGLAGCGQMDYKKTKSGLLYKVITTSDSKGPVAKMGNILKLNYQQKLNDSVLQTNYDKMAAYQPIDNSVINNEYSPTEIFTMLHKGDSAVTEMFVDSLILKGKMPTVPPFMKRGDRIFVTFKVVDIFASDSLARADNAKSMSVFREKEQKESDVKMVEEAKQVEDYLSAHQIKTEKTPRGVYVQIISPGTGMQADSGNHVSLRYKGTTFAGKVFDTNMDSSFHHTEPLEFRVGAAAIIPGFDDGVRLLKKGGKAKLFVPAVLGYGASPVMKDGKPFENLIFDIEVLDVTDKPLDPRMSMLKMDTSRRKK